ncbi:beta family protein [Yersinia intermedia]|uniref:beta family protein n=1 Tax=Yersinia intermedia TaxID=631 RepID=UPI000B6D693C|nr:beta family protein [Yersinia intermedia]MCW8110145.1 beta family protein [Yersinia intermedia]MDA5515136.1 beta family protein [Yersinia intermedia]OWF90432.1 hypothetical protein B4916_15785 [Yersinia intermedia]
MSVHHYYPQLRWKPAEHESLRELNQSTLDGITPIISVLDIDWDYENECYKKDLVTYLTDFGTNLAQSWLSPRPVLLDVGNLDIHSTGNNHPLDICISNARSSGKEVVPVYSPTYSADYLSAVKRQLTNGVAISLNLQNISLLSHIVSSININPAFVDVIINLGDIQQASRELQQQVTQDCVNVISQAHWRNIILSSSCYPTSQAGIPQNQIYQIRREEWILWTQVLQGYQWTRTPSFSDYPTASSVITSVDPRFMSQYVSVRYSDTNSWIFVKGSAVKGNGWGQTQGLCQILVSSPIYMGQQYSWGDNYIFNRAAALNTSGGSKEWRKVAHTHHLTLVVEQLANYSRQIPAKP